MTRPSVLNTRPREQSAELTTLLRAAGCDVVEAAAIAFVALEAPAIGADYDWVVLPSQNAARFLLAALGGALPRANILCGEATARVLQLEAAQTLAQFSARGALTALQPVLRPGDHVLVPSAAAGREELVDGLRARGVLVDAPVLYRTEPAPPATFAALPRLDAVTLCSPSAAVAVVGGLGRERLLATRLVCLGDTTADAAREAGLRVDGVANRTSMRSLVDAVMSALAVAV